MLHVHASTQKGMGGGVTGGRDTEECVWVNLVCTTLYGANMASGVGVCLCLCVCVGVWVCVCVCVCVYVCLCV